MFLFVSLETISYICVNLCFKRNRVSIENMSDFERMIDSLIEKKVEPLKKEIEDLKAQLSSKNEKEYLSTKDVQEIFSLSRTTLWRYHSKNLIKKYLVGEKTLFKKSEIESIIQAY